jgi:cell division protein FtsN
MPTMECATELPLADSEQGDSPIQSACAATEAKAKSPKGLIFGFAATVAAGLALTSWYVGARIVSADETAPAVAPAPVIPSPAQSPLAQTEWSAVPSVDLYLQVAALGARQDANFVRSLESRGFRARIASGNAGTHILIGPYSTPREMEQAQRKLESAGILAIETAE